jgi:hypothetical protein
MEALKSPVPLEQVFDLVLCVLLGETSDEELAWAIIDLSRYDAQGYCVKHGYRPLRLDFRILLEFRGSSDP